MVLGNPKSLPHLSKGFLSARDGGTRRCEKPWTAFDDLSPLISSFWTMFQAKIMAVVDMGGLHEPLSLQDTEYSSNPRRFKWSSVHVRERV